VPVTVTVTVTVNVIVVVNVAVASKWSVVSAGHIGRAQIAAKLLSMSAACALAFGKSLRFGIYSVW